MPPPVLRYENNEQAAHAVSRHLNSLRPSPQRYTVRPFNRFDTAFSAWWLIPSTDWPAFRHGKFAFHQGSGSRGMAAYMHVGYYVEHGYGKAAAEMVHRTYVMTDDWLWHRFIDAATSGRIDPTIAEVIERSSSPIIFDINAWAVNQPPDLETPTVAPIDWYETVIAPPGITAGEAYQKGGTVFRSLRGSTSLADLTQRIAAINGLDFYWINLTIGVRLPYGDLDTGTWGAAELWHNALEPWKAWVR